MDMEQPIQITETGGRFLVTPITDTNIFTREDFTEEQREIQEMVQGFCTEPVSYTHLTLPTNREV